jgi:hypothetical protein
MYTYNINCAGLQMIAITFPKRLRQQDIHANGAPSPALMIVK